MPSQGALAEPELDRPSVYHFDPATAELTRITDVDQQNGVDHAGDGRKTRCTMGQKPRREKEPRGRHQGAQKRRAAYLTRGED